MTAPEHWPMSLFPIKDNQLIVGGKPLAELAVRVGSTPFYAYDRQLLSERIAALRRFLPQGFGLRYAMKANPMAEVAAAMAKQVDGFDVSSVKEMATAMTAGMPPGKISFSGPGKTEEEINFAVKADVVVNLESERQLELVLAAGKTSGKIPKVAVRVNPDFEVKGSKMKMGGGARQFGFDSELVPDVLRKIAESGLAFEGFHIFSGSQNLSAEAVVEILANSFGLIYRLKETSKTEIRSVVVGGGFGIPYFPGDRPLDLAAVGERLAALAPEVKKRLPDAAVTIELGRYIVGECGIYVTRIIDKKVSRGELFLVTDGGMNHHLAASGHLGQVIRKNYPVAIGTQMDRGPKETASVVGPLCTPLDLLADKVLLPRAEIGDLVVVFQSGAYGLTASPLDFLSHPHPKEILL